MRWPRGRRLWLKIHLYLGLTAGAVLMVLGLTGSILVFADDIDRALNPGLFRITSAPPATRPSLDEIFRSIERGTGFRPYMLEFPSDKHASYLAFAKSSAVSEEPTAIHVDADTGEILASRQWGTYFVSFSRRLHTELLVGDGGHWLVAVCGLLALVSIGTGLYLWWPRGGAWRRALSFHWHRAAAPMNFELHRVCGFYLLAVLFIVSLSGIYLALPEPFDAAFAATSHEAAPPESGKPPPGSQPLTLTAVARIAARVSPHAAVTGLYIPSDPAESFTAYYRDSAEPHSEFGRSAVWIDRYNGRLIGAQSYADMGTAERALALQLLLHNGEIAGTLGKWLIFVCGLLPTLLFVTGFYLWWIKRR